jgi:acyl-CoA synthetase (AMP-forming)/AMP-acid ligase II
MTTLLHDLLDDAARRWPDKPALSSGEITWTHRELALASRRVAAWLAARGVAGGQRIVVVGPSAPLLPAVLFGAARIGAVVAILHEQVRGGALEHVVADAEPSLLVSDDDLSRAAAAARDVATVGVGELSGIASAADSPLFAPVQQPLIVDPVCLIYTSGSTGRPKAVVSTHQQMVFAAQAVQSQLNYTEDDIVYCPLPLSFDVGLYQLLLGALSGAHVWLGSAAAAGPLLLRNLALTRATILPAVPAVAEALARLQQRSKLDLALRLLTSTGAAMPAKVLRDLRAALPNMRIQLMFGLTECKRVSIMPPDGDLERPGACGRPLPGTEVFVIDEHGNRLPPGEIGQLVIRGPHVMAGYWRRPEINAEKFPRVEGLFPELRTGDYGWLDEDGYLYFHGRRDDIYKERGFRVSTTEVEAAALRTSGVDTAIVLAPSADRPAVLVVTGALTASEVLAEMRHQIEEFKVPRRCFVVPELPLSANGKVDRKAVAALIEEVAHA